MCVDETNQNSKTLILGKKIRFSNTCPKKTQYFCVVFKNIEILKIKNDKHMTRK